MAPATTSSSSLLQRIHTSCEAVVSHEKSAVKVNADQVQRFVEEIDWAQFQELAEPSRYPLNFKSMEDEINFMTLMAVLSFGSGFRSDLHRHCQRGAGETMTYGVLGMYISVPRLNAAFLKTLTIDTVAAYFSLPLDKDEEISPGIYVSKPGPLRPLASMTQQVLNECGRILEDRQCADFGQFIMKHLSSGEEGAKPTVSHLLEQLVQTFPAFDDQSVHHGISCVFLKRAQLLVHSLYQRFHESDARFAFEDVDELSALADNVLPCVLEELGVIKYTPELKDHIQKGKELQHGTAWECQVRAAAVVACDQILAALDRRIHAYALDMYLWRLGKTERFRPLVRHATRDTHCY